MRVIDFKDAKCRHCYKCVRHCAVKAISVRDEQARIMVDHCINCGRCLEVCPQNAKTFSSDLERVKGYLHQGLKTVISIAPSYAGVLDFDRPGQVLDALLRLGFSEVRETAEGAALVTNEYKKLVKAGKMPNIITTCCPSVNDLIEKYYPDCANLMAPVVSPMIAHGRYIKKLFGPDVKVVFLGPCIAKKQEAIGDSRVAGAVDAILTFEELAVWLKEDGIDLHSCAEKPMGNPDPKINRLYPVSGGVIQSVITEEDADGYHKVFVDGLENCMEMLECLQRGELDHCFIEANVCEGGCARGPASAHWNTSYVKTKVKIENGGDLSGGARTAGYEYRRTCKRVRRKRACRSPPFRGTDPQDLKIYRQIFPRGRAELRRLRIFYLPGKKRLRSSRARQSFPCACHTRSHGRNPWQMSSLMPLRTWFSS